MRWLKCESSKIALFSLIIVGSCLYEYFYLFFCQYIRTWLCPSVLHLKRQWYVKILLSFVKILRVRRLPSLPVPVILIPHPLLIAHQSFEGIYPDSMLKLNNKPQKNRKWHWSLNLNCHWSCHPSRYLNVVGECLKAFPFYSLRRLARIT